MVAKGRVVAEVTNCMDSPLLNFENGQGSQIDTYTYGQHSIFVTPLSTSNTLANYQFSVSKSSPSDTL